MIVDKLPNGYIVMVMSPREAVDLRDNILDPTDYPWQGSEAQITAMEARAKLQEQVEKSAAKDLKVAARDLGNRAEDENDD